VQRGVERDRDDHVAAHAPRLLGGSGPVRSVHYAWPCTGDGFVRVTIGTSSALLADIVDRMAAAVG
jgi:hypothetical protein